MYTITYTYMYMYVYMIAQYMIVHIHVRCEYSKPIMKMLVFAGLPASKMSRARSFSFVARIRNCFDSFTAVSTGALDTSTNSWMERLSLSFAKTIRSKTNYMYTDTVCCSN